MGQSQLPGNAPFPLTMIRIQNFTAKMESAGVLRNTHLENIWISRAFWIGYKPVPRYGAQLIQHTYQTAELSDLLRRKFFATTATRFHSS
ncbi:hypothetical protein Y032_0365g3583 [Ancylostoma ceylanicum]|uniref:Uncharacterized protein n=1 Tax=Ancylostoma ceylanicum TaxID=53326 RepID=A0A016RVP3_9BILA|nr:hypothetical protein Y032_0365g3583 [Ancylostoma ceylanicum]